MKSHLSYLIVMTVTSAACGGSSNSLVQPSGVMPTGTGPSALTVDGRKSFTNVGETSQLTAVLRSRDGSTRDVTSTARWTAQNTSVATVSSSGLVTSTGLGSARIEITYQELMDSFQISVTPAGTFAAAGDVREPGQGVLAGVRVLEPASG